MKRFCYYCSLILVGVADVKLRRTAARIKGSRVSREIQGSFFAKSGRN